MRINDLQVYTSKKYFNKELAIVSDVHISSHTKQNKLDEILNTLTDIKPNLILIPGDLYNSSDLDLKPEKVTQFLNEISKIASTYIALGNHELEPSFDKQDYKKLKHGGFITYSAFQLFNKIQNCQNNNDDWYFIGKGTDKFGINSDDFSISALNLDYDFYHKDRNIDLVHMHLDYIVKSINPSKFNILLVHEPIIIDYYEKLEQLKMFDLVICAHNHGGLIDEKYKLLFKLLPIFDYNKLFPKYTKGFIVKDNTEFMISEGITKFHSAFGFLEKYENNHESTIELIKIKRKDY